MAAVAGRAGASDEECPLLLDSPSTAPLSPLPPPQRIRATVNSQEQKRLLMDLDINMRTVDCFYTVTFYGALFREVSSSLAASPSRRRGWTWGQEGSGR